MKAAILEAPSRLSVREIAKPRPNDYQALVRMEVCGVCSGTDTKIFEGRKPCVVDYPSTFGHEGVGKVVEIGKRVKKYKVGDRVLRACAIYPSHVVDGIGSVWGSYAEYGLATDLETWRKEEPNGDHKRYGYGRLQLTVPDEFSAMEACLLITWKEIYSALTRLGDVKGKQVAIVGDGGVGLSFCKWASVLGAASITVIGRRDFRLERARVLGASRTINAHREKLPAERTFDMVVDTVGTSTVIQQMLPTLRDHGRIGVYGVSDTYQVEFDRSEGPTTWSFVQINPDEAECHAEVVALLKRHPFRVEDFVTRTDTLENLAGALAHLKEPQSLKAVIRFQ